MTKVLPERDDTDWAWLAGFIDGEGCITFHVYKGKKYAYHASLILSISQKDRRVLDKVKQIIGHGNINGPYANSGGGVYRYSINGDLVMTVCERIRPWLGQVKWEQYSNACGNWCDFANTKGTARIKP